MNFPATKYIKSNEVRMTSIQFWESALWWGVVAEESRGCRCETCTATRVCVLIYWLANYKDHSN